MSRKQNKPNSEALRRGLYVGAMVQDALDKRPYKITGFDEDGDPQWGNGDGNYACNCDLYTGATRFPTVGRRASTSRDGTERFVHIEISEGLHAEAVALLMTHFEGRK